MWCGYPPSPHHGKQPAKKLTEKRQRKRGVPPPVTDIFRNWGFWALSYVVFCFFSYKETFAALRLYHHDIAGTNWPMCTVGKLAVKWVRHRQVVLWLGALGALGYHSCIFHLRQLFLRMRIRVWQINADIHSYQNQYNRLTVAENNFFKTQDYNLLAPTGALREGVHRKKRF